MDAFIDKLLATDHWAIFGRWPLIFGFLAVAVHTGRRVGLNKALMASAAMFTGLAVGTSLLPSVIGAALGGALCWTITLRLMGERRSTAVPLALWMLGVVALGRVGCFIAGCCFGTPSELPFAASYGLNTPAHYTHHTMGWVHDHASHSLAVHPIQLYEGAFVAALFALTFALRRRVRSGLALALSVGAAYLWFRGAVDPLRGMVNTWGSLQYWGPFTAFQWSAFGGAGVMLAAAFGFSRERTSQPAHDGLHPAPIWLALAVAGFFARHAVPPLFYGLMVISLTAAATFLTAQSVARTARASGALRAAAAMVAALLLVPMWLHGEDSADGQDEPTASTQRWLYGVDRATGRLARIGNQHTDQRQLFRRSMRLIAGGPASVALPTSATPVTVTPVRKPLRWLTGSLALGTQTYFDNNAESGDGCGGGSAPTVFEQGAIQTFAARFGMRWDSDAHELSPWYQGFSHELWVSALFAYQTAEAGPAEGEPIGNTKRTSGAFEVGGWTDIDMKFGGGGVGAAMGLLSRGNGDTSTVDVSFVPMLYLYAGYYAYLEMGMNTSWLRTIPAVSQLSEFFHFGLMLRLSDFRFSGGLLFQDGLIQKQLGAGLLAKELMRESVSVNGGAYYYARAQWVGRRSAYRAGVVLLASPEGEAPDNLQGLVTLAFPFE